VSSVGSVTKLVGQLRHKDEGAAQRLWELFRCRLLALARVSLPSAPLGVADEEDVVQSALGSFFTNVEKGKFTRLASRHALWHLLVIITKRKARRLLQREGWRRNAVPGGQQAWAPPCKRQILRDDDLNQAPSAEFQALMEEECGRLLDALGEPQLRSLAIWKMEGYSEAEMAAMLGCSPRTVQRKLDLIRTIWWREMNL